MPCKTEENIKMSNDNIDIKDIKTTSELSQEEMDEVKGGATAGGTTGTSTPTTSGPEPGGWGW